MKNKIIFVLIVTLFFGGLISVNTAKAEVTSISQLLEILINAGLITPDKIPAATALVSKYSLGVPSVFNVSATSTGSAASSSDYLQVLAPDGGESWDLDVGVSRNIIWGSSNPVSVIISLVPTKGNVCNLVSAPITSKKGENKFSILLKTAKCFNLTNGSSTPLVDGTYKVRVSYKNSSGVEIKDESKASFRILPIPEPSIKITNPNGGESVLKGKNYKIKYTLKNVPFGDYLSLVFLDSNGNSAFNTRKITSSNGICSLDVPSSMATGAYKLQLKLTTKDHKDIEDISDNYFWISSGL